MQLAAETRRPGHYVVGYGAAEVRLADRTLTRSAIVTLEQVQDWALATLEELDALRLAPLVALRPEVVLLATGARQRFPGGAAYAEAAAHGFALEPMDLGAACRTYNVLAGEARRVALAVILP